jgi:hypothetical protein
MEVGSEIMDHHVATRIITEMQTKKNVEDKDKNNNEKSAVKKANVLD